MTTVRISGGLGNQMFQYALGRKLSLLRKEKLVINISAYENYTLFSYGLDCYNISCDTSNSQLLYNNKYFRKALKTFAKLGIKRYFNYYIEQRLFVYDNAALITNANILLGSWQSFKYFEDIKDIIADDFTLKAPISLECSRIIHQMNISESISIHIRRGDYFSDKRAKKDHGILGLDYFEDALRFVTKSLRNPFIFIFSDDINWVKENFYTEHPIHYIDNSFGGPEISIHLMTKCKHNIISNSSFSWWGAWLNLNPNKIVVAPKIWFRDNPTSSDLVPNDWTLM